MDLLILGGTRFVGRAIAEAALRAGAAVTLFHRGRHVPQLEGEWRTLRGDRDGDLGALRGGTWDAVIDTSGYTAPQVRATAELLAGSARHYTFISTISVYADSREPLSEESPLLPPEPASREVSGESYGRMKVAGENELARLIRDRHLVIRPGVVVGPHDYTDRFTYWCRRIAAGGEVLAPGEPGRPVQWIDARDLGSWVVRMTESWRTGTFNATGPAIPATIDEMLGGIRAATGSDARFTWVADAFLDDHDVRLPFSLPEPIIGAYRVSNARALAAGLALRPLEQTVRDTLAWDRGRGGDSALRAGLSAHRERELLRAWESAQ